MAGRRSRAREVTLQLLFQVDQNQRAMNRNAVEAFVRDRLSNDADTGVFSLALFDGVLANREAIDKLISAAATNWKLHRMLPVDRNMLRMAVYEMRFAPDPTPTPAAINEAIELSRRYGSADSPSFVNGILDAIAKAPSAE